MKRCCTSLVTREIIQNCSLTPAYHRASTGTAKTKYRWCSVLQGYETTATSVHWGFWKAIPLYLFKVNAGTSYQPATPFLDGYSTETCACIHGETCVRIQGGTLAIAKTLSSVSVYYAWVCSLQLWRRVDPLVYWLADTTCLGHSNSRFHIGLTTQGQEP